MNPSSFAFNSTLDWLVCSSILLPPPPHFRRFPTLPRRNNLSFWLCTRLPWNVGMGYSLILSRLPNNTSLNFTATKCLSVYVAPNTALFFGPSFLLFPSYDHPWTLLRCKNPLPFWYHAIGPFKSPPLMTDVPKTQPNNKHNDIYAPPNHPTPSFNPAFYPPGLGLTQFS